MGPCLKIKILLLIVSADMVRTHEIDLSTVRYYWGGREDRIKVAQVMLGIHIKVLC